MHEIYFLARHTPFWAIPLGILSLEFAYVFWLKKRKRTVALYLILSMLCGFAAGFYFWAGGPEKTVITIKKFYINNF